MKGNPQSIEVGDVVTFRNTTSKVLEVTGNNSTGNCFITVYSLGELRKVNVQVEDVRIVRKWHDNIESKDQNKWHFSQAVTVEEMPLAFINVAVRCGLIPNYPSTHGPDEIVIDKEWLDEIIAFLNKVLSDNVEGCFECKSMNDIKFYDSYSPVIPIVDLYRLVNKVLPNAIRRVISTKCATCGYDPARHKSKNN